MKSGSGPTSWLFLKSALSAARQRMAPPAQAQNHQVRFRCFLFFVSVKP
jgi:hypothetical protein